MLEELGADAVGGLGSDLEREEPLELLHGRRHDLLVGLGDPVGVAAGDWRARRKDELEHGLLLVVVLLAGGGHVGVDGEERGPGEAEVVHVLELTVEPEVDVDDGDALELLDLVEEGHGAPLLGHHPLHDVHGNRGDVLVRDDLLAGHHLEALDAAVVVEHELLDALLQLDVAAASLDVVHHRRAEPVGLVAVEEGHLQPVGLVEETVHGGQYDGH